MGLLASFVVRRCRRRVIAWFCRVRQKKSKQPFALIEEVLLQIWEERGEEQKKKSGRGTLRLEARLVAFYTYASKQDPNANFFWLSFVFFLFGFCFALSFFESSNQPIKLLLPFFSLAWP